MNRGFKSLILALPWLLPLGCSGVKFENVPNPICDKYVSEFGANSCSIGDGLVHFNYSVTSGVVDILFVDDNSGSMYPEQAEMANRFPGFLDSIYNLDYRIAITTTDVTHSPGGFVSFPGGRKFIGNNSRVMDAKHEQNILDFQNTIKRPETLTCDTSNFTNCPSGDERGIFALNQAISRIDQHGFFRPGGHLAVVILSDEDERTNGGQISGYPLEDLDYPATFVQNIGPRLGDTKTVSVHSIIIRPGDSSCLSIQNSQTGVKGYYGYQYAQLSLPDSTLKATGHIVDGVLGSICSNNYTNELGDIADKISQHLEVIQLPCHPKDELVDIVFNPAPNQQVTYSVDSGNRLHLNPPAPAGTKVTLAFTCQLH